MLLSRPLCSIKEAVNSLISFFQGHWAIGKIPHEGVPLLYVLHVDVSTDGLESKEYIAKMTFVPMVLKERNISAKLMKHWVNLKEIELISQGERFGGCLRV